MNPPPPRKLLDVVRETIRLKHYSYRTEQTYLDWIKRYLLFHQKKHPREMVGLIHSPIRISKVKAITVR